MESGGRGNLIRFASRLCIAIGLMTMSSCSSGIPGEADGGGGSGGIGGFGGNNAAETAPDDAIRQIDDGIDQVLAPPSNAISCTTNGQCSSGYCVDGFCCDTKCDYGCMACSAAKKGQGQDGICGSIKYDLDPDNDCPLGACDGKNACKNYNGVACTSAAQCLSNYCVDGFCCNNICMGTCTACSAAKKGGGINGQCGGIAINTNPDAECSNGGVCNGSGACTTPQTKQAAGTACTSGPQCQSGYCADGVCCDSWCLGTCQACTAAKKGSGIDGVCGPIANDKDPDEECWGGACNGSGVCKQYNGVPCTAGSQCLSNYCVDGFCCGNICTGMCYACSEARKGQGYDGVCGPISSGKDPDNECNPGECGGSGTCNQPQVPQLNGTQCVSGGQCASGNCVDGVCCDTACSGTCQACTATKKGSGANGVCGVIATETDPDGECSGGRCDGKGVCRYYNGAPCSTTGQCFSNYCVDGFCCGNICSGACQACSAAKKGSGYDGVCGNIVGGSDPDNECNPGECGGSGACNQPQAQQPNGATCSLATNCLSGFCVDGVCCDNACAGTCQACSAAKKGTGTNGTCGNIIAATDPDNECLSADCSGQGTCLSPTNLPNGVACTGASQCLSGNCVDSVCCDTACTGSCQACTATKKGQGLSGYCGPIKYDTDPDEECANGACDGAGLCRQYNGVSCTTTTQCLSNYCVDGFCCNNICSGACQACSAAKKGSGWDGGCGQITSGTDPDNECNPGECNGAGACTQPQVPQPNGASCSSGANCTSGFCVDGVCCDTACTGSCQACSATKKGQGTSGTCGPIVTGTDPDNECPTGDCNGSGVCTTPAAPDGTACTLGTQCASGNCVDGVCCNTACTGSCQACSAAKKGQGSNGTCGAIVTGTDPDNECTNGDCNGSGACTIPPAGNGAACNTAAECASAFCVDGVCCDNACTGTCQACTAAKKGQGADGTCGPIIAASDPDNECTDGNCDGSGACTVPPPPPAGNGTACSTAAECASGFCTDGVCCNNACTETCQACTAAKKGQGTDGTCGVIITGTDPDNECTNAECNGAGACTVAPPPPAPNGTACATASECASGFCADGVCCDTACTSTCQACTAAKMGQGTDGTCGNIITGTDPDDECANGNCNGSGVCTTPPPPPAADGTACSTASECASGFCTDGVCCESACSGTCQACTVAKTGLGGDGICGLVVTGTDPDNECTDGECNELGACTTPPPLASNGATCSAGAQCASGFCVDGVCCDNACSGTCVACTTAKKGQGVDGACGPIKFDTNPDNECLYSACDGAGTCRYYNGAPCGLATNCLSNYCVDGVCCGNICTGSCSACSAFKKGQGYDGVCGVIASGLDPDDECGVSTCNGSGICAPIPCSQGSDCASGYCLGGQCAQDVVQVATHGSRSCALLASGAVKCWGLNNGGMLGTGDSITRGDDSSEMGANLPAVNLGTGKTAAQIAMGEFHTCALLDEGTVKCWGNNTWGQLGRGDSVSSIGGQPSDMGDNLPIVNLGTGKTAVQIAVGVGHTCAILNDGSVKCWGFNSNGRLGVGDTLNRGQAASDMGDNLPAVDLGTNKTATAIVAGGTHTCALLNDGSVKCWGDNSSGQLGQGDVAHRGDNANEMGNNLLAIDLGTGKTAVQIGAGYSHSCARLNDNSVKCWGSNTTGQLGQGDTQARGDGANEMGNNLAPINLGTGKTAVFLATGYAHACAILNNGTMRCWGNNDQGRLGLGNAAHRGDDANEMGDFLPSVEVGTGKAALAVGAGMRHNCAILNDGKVKCWGLNDNGQLGIGNNVTRGDNANEMGDTLPAVSLF